VIDEKIVDERHFVVVNGGRHQFTYHGGISQMGKRKPDVTAVRNASKYEMQTYTVVGPLCNESDILAINIELPTLDIGDYLIFKNAGAYSITEGSALFLSRDLPAVYYEKNGHLLLKRERNQTEWLRAIYKENDL
jgi:diaminopimelate decarboxylase